MEPNYWLRRLVILGAGGLDLQLEQPENLTWIAHELRRDDWFHENISSLLLNVSRLGTEAAQDCSVFLQRALNLTEVRIDAEPDENTVDAETQRMVDSLVQSLACNTQSRLTEVSVLVFPSTTLFHDLLQAHYASLEDIRTGGHGFTSFSNSDVRDQQVFATLLLPGSTLSKIIHLFVPPRHWSQLLESLLDLPNLCNLKLSLYTGNPQILESTRQFLQSASCPEIAVWNHTGMELDATPLLTSLLLKSSSHSDAPRTFGLFEFAILGFSEQDIIPTISSIERQCPVQELILEECCFTENSVRALTEFGRLQKLHLQHARPRLVAPRSASNSTSDHGEQEEDLSFPVTSLILEPLRQVIGVHMLDLTGTKLETDELDRLCLLLEQEDEPIESLTLGPEFSSRDTSYLPDDGVARLFRRLGTGLKHLVFTGRIEGIEDSQCIVNSLERNTTLMTLDGLEFPNELQPHKDLVEFYLRFNRRGRYLLEQEWVPLALWPLVLAHSSSDCSVLHGLVRGVAGIVWNRR